MNEKPDLFKIILKDEKHNKDFMLGSFNCLEASFVGLTTTSICVGDGTYRFNETELTMADEVSFILTKEKAKSIMSTDDYVCLFDYVKHNRSITSVVKVYADGSEEVIKPIWQENEHGHNNAQYACVDDKDNYLGIYMGDYPEEFASHFEDVINKRLHESTNKEQGGDRLCL